MAKLNRIAARIWALDSPTWTFTRLYVAEADAKQAGEAFVRENTERKDVGDLEWRDLPAGGGSELWGATGGKTGRWLPANLCVYTMDVFGEPLATAQDMPQPPAEDHAVPADGRPEPAPFDFEAYDEREHLLVRDHWHDTARRWALARLREYTQLSDTLPGHTAAAPSWQESNARVSDIREAFLEIGRIEAQVREARELAKQLLAAGLEQADDLGFLGAHDPDLSHELLPEWLTNETGAPETWQRPHADELAQREEEADIMRGEYNGADDFYGYDDEGNRA